MRDENLLTLIGVAGSYPLAAVGPPPSSHWQAFEGHASQHLRQERFFSRYLMPLSSNIRWGLFRNRLDISHSD